MGFDREVVRPNMERRKRPRRPHRAFMGPGPVAPGAEHAPSRDSGKYNGRSPDMTEPRRKHRRDDPPPGYPGDRVAL
jgi:hypothetical protein